MTAPLRSTIAQMLYLAPEALDFRKAVGSLETVLTRNREEALRVHWDCDDVVNFDIGETRILLAWSTQARGGYGACLTVSVGPLHLHGAGSLDLEISRGVLCSRLVEEIRHRAMPLGIIWRELDGLVDAEVSDSLADLLPPVDSILHHVARTDLIHSAAQVLHLKAQRPGPRVWAHEEQSPPAASAPGRLVQALSALANRLLARPAPGTDAPAPPRRRKSALRA